jgi:hypothetical protein
MQILIDFWECLGNILKEHKEILKWIIPIFFSGGAVAIISYIFKKKEIIEVTRFENKEHVILEFYHNGKMEIGNITIGLELFWFHFELIWGVITNTVNKITLIKSDEKSENVLDIFSPCRIVNIEFAPFNPGDRYFILYTTNKNEKPKISINKSMIIREKKCNKKREKQIKDNLRSHAKNMVFLYVEGNRFSRLDDVFFKDNPEFKNTDISDLYKRMQEAIEIGRINQNIERKKND